MEPWQSWIVAIILGGAATWYYSRDSNFKNGKVKRAGVLEHNSIQEDWKRREKNCSRRKKPPFRSLAGERFNHGIDPQVEESLQSRTEKMSIAGSAVGHANESQNSQRRQEESINQQMVHQLEVGKHEVSLRKSSKHLSTTNSNDRVVVDYVDDHLESGVNSRNTIFDDTDEARTQNHSKDSSKMGAVNLGSDMLETPAHSRLVLRISGNLTPRKVEAAPLSQSKETKQTKKQRQNRRRNEEKRGLKEEQEQERRIALEKQRRQAREARGEPTRNGLGSRTMNGTWSSTRETQMKPHAVVEVNLSNKLDTSESALLDTFEQHEITTAGLSNPKMASAFPASTTSTYLSTPSIEELQLEIPSRTSQDIGWNKVSKKPKKGKKRGQDLSTSHSLQDDRFGVSGLESSTNQIEALHLKSSSCIPATKQSAESKDVHIHGPITRGHPSDSDWAVM